MKIYGMESPDSSRKRLSRSLEACLANSQRLVDESYDIEFREPTSTRFYLLIIAQEEAAKAFILHLVRDGVVPLSKEIRRAMNDHVCKQLVGILMDYLVLRWVSMDELEAKVRRDFELGDLFPQDIGSALEIFAYEKDQRWQSAWKMISTLHPGLTRRLAEAKFNFGKVVELDWTEPMRRIGTPDGFFG